MTVRKSISFTKRHDDWLKSQIASGKYTSDSEVVRDRQQQEREGKFDALKTAIQDGIGSGISDKQVPDIMREVEERLLADGKS